MFGGEVEGGEGEGGQTHLFSGDSPSRDASNGVTGSGG